MKFEYVVWDNSGGGIHRGPWNYQECAEWIEECKEFFPDAKAGAIDKMWSVRRRAVGEWEEF